MAKGTGTEVQAFFPHGWDTSEWMVKATVQELRAAVASTWSKYPGLQVRVIKNGKEVPLPKGA